MSFAFALVSGGNVGFDLDIGFGSESELESEDQIRICYRCRPASDDEEVEEESSTAPDQERLYTCIATTNM